jgi:hypothetical protein
VTHIEVNLDMQQQLKLHLQERDVSLRRLNQHILKQSKIAGRFGSGTWRRALIHR